MKREVSKLDIVYFYSDVYESTSFKLIPHFHFECRPPTLEIRPEKQKIRLNSDPFLTKNQTKFRLIWE